MSSNQIILTPVPLSKEILSELDGKGLVRLFKPTPKILNPGPEENIGDPLYISDPAYGSHCLVAVGVNKTHVQLGVHKDNEEFLIPEQDEGVKPVYLVICHLPQEEIRRRDHAGILTAEDFTCLNLHIALRGAEMFTMLKGTAHCEVTSAGSGRIGYFFVTEGSNLDVEWIYLENTELKIAE